MCRNLRYNLDHLKLCDKPAYLRIVDSIVIGPNCLLAEDVERVLGINSYLFKRSTSRRDELIRTKKRPLWWAGRGADMYTIWEHYQKEERRVSEHNQPEDRKRREHHQQEERRGSEHNQPEERKRSRSHSKARKVQVPEPLVAHTVLEQQFTLFSRFGSIGFDGGQITLSQSDKWLKQAGIIDGWNITTTDTAIAFRKFSRGNTRLGLSAWKEFMVELASCKKITIGQVWRRLENCGKPGLNVKFECKPFHTS